MLTKIPVTMTFSVSLIVFIVLDKSTMCEHIISYLYLLIRFDRRLAAYVTDTAVGSWHVC